MAPTAEMARAAAPDKAGTNDEAALLPPAGGVPELLADAVVVVVVGTGLMFVGVVHLAGVVIFGGRLVLVGTLDGTILKSPE